MGAVRYVVICLLAIMFGFLTSFCGPPKPTEVPGLEEQMIRPKWEDLKKQLEADQASTRAQAILIVMQFDIRDATALLLDMARNDPAYNVRQTAAMALGQFKIKKAAPILIHLLKNDKQVQPEFIMQAAEQLGQPSVAAAIVPWLESDVNNTRLIAVQTLTALKARSQGRAILSMAQKNKNSDKSRAYTMLLGNLQIKQAAGHLRKIASAGKPGPNQAAAYIALGQIQDKGAVDILIQGLQSDQAKLRENAVKGLVMIQDKSSLPKIYPLLKSSNVEIAYSAADVLSNIRDPRTTKIVINLILNGPDVSIGPAAQVAGQLKLQQTRAVIETRLTDKKSPSRQQLAQALGWLGGTKSLDLLIRVLQEESGKGRYGAAWSLGIIGDSKALPALVKAANSSDAGLARISAEALGGIQNPQSVAALASLVKSNSGVRHSAAESIAAIPGPEAQKELLKFMKMNDSNLKRIAMRAFAERKIKAAVPLLMQELSERDPTTQPLAILALKNITGQNFSRAGQWQHWYEINKQ